MPFPLIQVDAFTDTPFAGNPAAVCILPAPKEDAWMQAVAAEMNLAETAFLMPHEDPFVRAYRLRWFTPTTEVDLCGHATLASAHALWTEGYMRPDQTCRFITKSGELTCTRGEDGWIYMDFPKLDVVPMALDDKVLNLLGFEEIVFTGKIMYGEKFGYFVEFASADGVRDFAPNFARLAQLPARNLLITAQGDDGEHDFVSRMFAPKMGVNEDPVTGSTHCRLSPYWSEKLGRNELVGQQVSARGGVVKTILNGDRVTLGGKAVTILKGELV